MEKGAAAAAAVLLLLKLCWFNAAAQPANTSNGFVPVRSVSLGGWLVIEKWMKPSLFDGIPEPELLDGALVKFKSTVLDTYISAVNGGGSFVSVNGTSASGWATFKLWRITSSQFQFRASNNQFLTTPVTEGAPLLANVQDPGALETFEIVRNNATKNLVQIRASNGMYLQAVNSSSGLTADAPNSGLDWSLDNPAVFQMSVDTVLGGEYQLANGYGDAAAEVFKNHRDNFITQDDFTTLAANGINNVRIPVGWWIASDPNPPPPFVSGSLEALDRAFDWAKESGVTVLVDLHAAPGSQNQWEHCATRDGVSQWADPNANYIPETLGVIDFLASRYADHPAFFGLELVNEPSQGHVPLSTLKSFYAEGYKVVRKHSSTAFVVFCQLIGANPNLLVNDFKPADGYTNVALDVHWYNLFENRFANTSAQWNIDYVLHQRGAELRALNSAGGPLILVGEWTNEWEVSNASDDDYRNFGSAQLRVFDNATLGWSYWSLKSKDLHWDFERTSRVGLLPRLPNGQWP